MWICDDWDMVGCGVEYVCNVVRCNVLGCGVKGVGY